MRLRDVKEMAKEREYTTGIATLHRDTRQEREKLQEYFQDLLKVKGVEEAVEFILGERYRGRIKKIGLEMSESGELWPEAGGWGGVKYGIWCHLCSVLER